MACRILGLFSISMRGSRSDELKQRMARFDDLWFTHTQQIQTRPPSKRAPVKRGIHWLVHGTKKCGRRRSPTTNWSVRTSDMFEPAKRRTAGKYSLIRIRTHASGDRHENQQFNFSYLNSGYTTPTSQQPPSLAVFLLYTLVTAVGCLPMRWLLFDLTAKVQEQHGVLVEHTNPQS